MDLIAVVSQEENLDVYRLNGQRAFGRRRKDVTSTVNSICWKFNGQLLAIAWNDGVVETVSAENGKLVPSDFRESTAKNPKRITCLGWGVNFIDAKAVKDRTGETQNDSSRTLEDFTVKNWASIKDTVSIEDFLQRQPDLQALDIHPDLPDTLSLNDIESLLPKLPVIPSPPLGPLSRAVHTIPEVFASQLSIDTLFHSHHLKDHNSVDILVSCHENGSLNPTIYDSLEIAGIGLQDLWKDFELRIIRHCSHPFTSSHVLIVQTGHRSKGSGLTEAATDNFKLAIVPLTFRFISSAGIYLYIIASRTAQVQNLLRYIQECRMCLSAYLQHSQDLPNRFMRNIAETLSEKGEGDLVQALYHLAVTGHCPPTIKEWLVDELTESGHKRWDHSVIQGYAKIIDILHENFLPALDRCSILISMLRGIAKFHDSGWVFDVPIQDFTNILDTIQCLRILGHTALLVASEERKQFMVFSRWLRHEIDVQASDSIPSSEDPVDRDLGIDYALVLDYIRGGLNASRIGPILRKSIDGPGLRLEDTATTENLLKALEKFKHGSSANEELLCLHTVSSQLRDKCIRLFEQITKWQASSTSMSCGLVLEDSRDVVAYDVRMMPTTASRMYTFVAVVVEGKNSEIQIHAILHNQTFDSINSVHYKDEVTIDISKGQVRDVQFSDDKELLALVKTEATSYILSFQYQGLDWPSNLEKAPEMASRLESLQLPHGKAEGPRRSWKIKSMEDLGPLGVVKHRFSEKDHFSPLKLVVNGRKNRRVICVVGEDLKHYRVYDMDFPGAKENGSKDSGDDEDITMTG